MAKRVSIWNWQSKYIRHIVKEVLNNPQFKVKAESLKGLSRDINSEQIIAKEVWSFLMKT